MELVKLVRLVSRTGQSTSGQAAHLPEESPGQILLQPRQEVDCSVS